MTSALGVGGIVIRGQRLSIRSFSRDATAAGRWKTRLSGKNRHFGDPANALSTLAGSQFGLADAAKGVFVTPLAMETGELINEPVSKDDVAYKDTNNTWWVRGYLEMPDASRLVDYTAAASIVDGSATASSVQRAWDLIVVALAPRQESNTLQYVRWFGAFVAGAGVVLGARYLGSSLLGPGGGGGGGVELPLGALAVGFDVILVII
jgi:hypothetical protein